jgi:Family of unknown function (DUF6263)
MKKNVLVLMAVVAGVAATAQTYKPAVKLEAGKKYMVNTAVKANMTQEAMGQTMEIPMESSVYQLLEIKGAGADGYQSANTTQRITFSASMMGQEIIYDSDKKEDREGRMGASMNNMVGQTTTFTVDKDGRVIEKSIVKPEVKAKEAGAEGGGEDMMGSMMSNMGLGDNTSSPALNLFPNNKELKAGDSFTEVIDADNGKIKTTTIYKLDAVKDGMAVFSFTGTSTMEKKMEMQGMEMNTVSSTKSSGTMLVDIATGLLSKKTTVSETTGNVEVSGMQIPITGKTTTTTEVVPAK